MAPGMAIDQEAEQWTPPYAHHAEGPVWFPDDDIDGLPAGLRWVDMLAGDVLAFDAAGSLSRRNFGAVAAVLRPRIGGGFVIAVERGFALVDADGSEHRLPDLWSDPSIRMNEGGCDPDGRFWAGSMAYDKTPGRGTMWRLDPDGSVTEMFGALTISNGLAWSPDGSLAYFNDTPTHRVDVFSYDSERGLHDRRPFALIDEADGSPDGLTVDSEGSVWVALYGGSAVRRYRSDGTLDGVVGLPVSQITACTFGGAALDELYITTSAENDSPDKEAGAVFRAKVGVTGLPVAPFAG